MKYLQYLLRPLVLILILITASLPSIYCFIHYAYKQQLLEGRRLEYLALRPKVTKLLLSPNNIQTFVQKYQNSDRIYCEKYLEPLVFLKNSVDQLEILASFSSFSHYPSLTRRLHFLKGKENRICLKSMHTHTLQGIDETEEQLMHPIEMNHKDLSNVLTILEGLPGAALHRPQIFVTRFDLEKTAESYLINFSLLKRELSATGGDR